MGARTPARPRPLAWERMRRLVGWVLLLLLVAACHGEAPKDRGMRLFFLRRGATDWTLISTAVPEGEPRQLAEGVEGYAVAAGRLALLRAGAITVDGGGGGWSWPCPTDCYALTLSPQGDALAWLEGDYPATLLYLRPLNGEETVALGKVRSRPVWSPDGEYLAAATGEGLLLWSKAVAMTETLPLKVISPPTWVDAEQLALVVAPGRVVLYRLGAPFPTPLILGDEATVEAAWSPCGNKALLLRWEHRPPSAGEKPQEDRQGAIAVGAQPFLYDGATGSVEALPGDAGAVFTHPAWSPDGDYLALVRMEVGVADPQPQLWLYDIAQRSVVRRFEEAALPAWGEGP